MSRSAPLTNVILRFAPNAAAAVAAGALSLLCSCGAGNNAAGESQGGVGHWSTVQTGPISATDGRSNAVWNGTELFVWGNLDRMGALFTPERASWSNVDQTTGPGADIGESLHGLSGASRVWIDNNRLLLWSGSACGPFRRSSCDTAYVYDKTANSWTTLTTTAPVSGREAHTTLWTGEEMIIWGGDHVVDGPNYFQVNDGAIYNPARDEWRPMSMDGAPSPRDQHVSIWTGKVVLIWGGRQSRGTGAPAFLGDGAVYDPTANTWRAIANTGAPSPRMWHSAVWTGSEMIVWGGITGTEFAPDDWEHRQDGFAYDPASDRWRPISTKGAPVGRSQHSAVWTGSKMLVWGGFPSRGTCNDGGIYDPATDTWQRITTEGAPRARAQHMAIWLGDRMFVYGGNDTESIIPFNEGAFFTP